MRQLIKLTVAGSLIWGALSPALAPVVAADANVPADVSVPARQTGRPVEALRNVPPRTVDHVADCRLARSAVSVSHGARL